MKQDIKDTADYEALLVWSEEKSIILGETILNDKAKYDLL